MKYRFLLFLHRIGLTNLSYRDAWFLKIKAWCEKQNAKNPDSKLIQKVARDYIKKNVSRF